MSQETWEFINTFAPWFSAIGTVSAVVVSLYLARRDRNVRLQVSAGHRVLITRGSDHRPEYLNIRVVNVGHREAQISNIGWKFGFLKKQHAIQMLEDNTISSALPVRLKDGEEANYFISLNDGWLGEYIDDFLRPFPWIKKHFVKVVVHTSLGTKFESNIENSLKSEISKKCKKP
jgi:hypothetical protein